MKTAATNSSNKNQNVNPMSLSAVRDFWRATARHPSKRLGQNFLVDANIVRIILNAANVKPADTVLEIGAGLGALTSRLVVYAKQVVAVEKDRHLYNHLSATTSDIPNLRLIHGDALELDYTALLGDTPYKLVANLPYSTGTAMIVNFLRAQCPPVNMVVTLQLEVARRLAATVGTADYGLLSIWAALDYQTEIVKTIAPTCFWPAPQVKSAVIRLQRRPEPLLDISDRPLFFALTKQAFARRRKQISTVLRGLPLLQSLPADTITSLPSLAGIDPRARPESLAVADWGRLSTVIKKKD